MKTLQTYHVLSFFLLVFVVQVLQASRKDASAQEVEMKMREEMEMKMSQADEQYRADLLAQEKKFKMQAKKNKEEFRKLLNENGVNDQVCGFTLSDKNDKVFFGWYSLLISKVSLQMLLKESRILLSNCLLELEEVILGKHP